MRFWLLRKLQPCDEMVALMSESLERRLSAAEAIKLRLHLLVCAWCARYLKQLKFLRRILRLDRHAHSEESLSATSLSPEARERILTALARKESSS